MSRLEPELEQLLATIVEIVRSVPREQRDAFIVAETNQGASLVMPGVRQQPRVAMSDIRELASVGLLRWVPGGSQYTTRYEVTYAGFEYADGLSRLAAGPAEAVEEAVARYLDASGFTSRHGSSLAKWQQAADELWGDDTGKAMTSIGHHIREAMISFAAECVDRYQVDGADPGPEKTVNRLRATVAQAARGLGETERPMLDALIVYWGTVGDLADRQEHGAVKKVPLVHEDARRLVFQTAMVMFELDRAFVRAFGR